MNAARHYLALASPTLAQTPVDHLLSLEIAAVSLRFDVPDATQRRNMDKKSEMCCTVRLRVPNSLTSMLAFVSGHAKLLGARSLSALAAT